LRHKESKIACSSGIGGSLFERSIRFGQVAVFGAAGEVRIAVAATERGEERGVDADPDGVLPGVDIGNSRPRTLHSLAESN
jgi:hypothetical protein